MEKVFHLIILMSAVIVLTALTPSLAQPSYCQQYFGDSICDDSKQDCGSAYVESTNPNDPASGSIPECNECQTGGYDCSKVKSLPKEGPDSPICKAYYGDNICDDKKEKCGNDYKQSISLDSCQECSTGGFACATVSKPTTGPESSLCQTYGLSSDPYCDDTKENCASGFVEGISEPSCQECSTGKWKDCKIYYLLVVLLNFQDSSTVPFSKEQAESLIFGGQVQKFYQEQSYGKAILGGNVLGWHTLSREGDPGGTCMYPTIGEVEIQDFIINNGVNPSNYRHLLLVYNHPCMQKSTGGGIQQVQIKGKSFQLSQLGANARGLNPRGHPFTWTDFDDMVAHELGHGLGLNHAELWECDAGITFGAGKNCRETGYGNTFDLMGHGSRALHFNAVFKEFLNWFDSSSLLTIVSSGRYTLSPYEGNSGFRAAKIKVPGHELYPIYLEYRQPLGFDASLSNPLFVSNTRGLLVNWKAGVEEVIGVITSRHISNLLDFSPQSDDFADFNDVTLNVGQRFTVPGGGITIGPVISADASGITFDVILEDTPCIRDLLDNSRTIPWSIDPGETKFFTEVLYNEDGFTCDPSDFGLTLTVPQGWSGRVNWVTSNNRVTLAPGDSFLPGYFVTAPQNVNAGSYPVEVYMNNLITGTSKKLITFIFTVPPKP